MTDLRQEEAVYIDACCPCGWMGDAEVFEGEFAYPCPLCGSELARA